MLNLPVLLAATAAIDVAIPGLVGLALVAFPRFAFKASGNDDVDSARASKFRMLGGVLMLVAGIYTCVMYLQP